jgi:hypothetical protein
VDFWDCLLARIETIPSGSLTTFISGGYYR